MQLADSISDTIGIIIMLIVMYRAILFSKDVCHSVILTTVIWW